jgi:hypothetical protein
MGLSYKIVPLQLERYNMTNKTFYITYWASKHKKHITRKGKHDDKSRYGTSKQGVPYYVYYDLDSHGYRTATTTWKVRH